MNPSLIPAAVQASKTQASDRSDTSNKFLSYLTHGHIKYTNGKTSFKSRLERRDLLM